MKWVIRRAGGVSDQTWRSLWTVYVDEKRAEVFGQHLNGEWRLLGFGTAKLGGIYLTRRAARRAALISAGVDPDKKVKVPAAFYDES
jgi:hypothetical protein